jgi:serine-type D-Ala-D-Ala carboxypeptidase/endopeptidase (penicillin-binding protein 4)
LELALKDNALFSSKRSRSSSSKILAWEYRVAGVFGRYLIWVLLAIAPISIYPPTQVQAETNRAPQRQVCARKLEAEINQIAQMPNLRASRLGVFVNLLSESPKALVNLDGDKYFIPASNAKLFTTAAVLRLLGRSDRIRTTLNAMQPIAANGEISGGLWVGGGGDPSFSTDTLKVLVKQLGQKGVKRIKGGIYAVPKFRSSGLGMGWEWQDLQEDYGAIAHALTINGNVLDWTIRPSQVGQPVSFSWDSPGLASGWTVENLARTGAKGSKYSLKVERHLNSQRLIISGQIPLDNEPELGATAVPNPSAHFLKLLTAELIAQGIQIDSASSPIDGASQAKLGLPTIELATVSSPTIAELARTTNKDSNNLYAELLLRQLGWRSPQKDIDDAGEAGIQVVTTFIQKQGISSNSFNLADAAGLSRRNAIAPRAIVQLLQIMQSDRAFRDSLAIAAVDGTLKNRFKDTPAQANLSGKTGTLSDAIALSGYVKPTGYDELAFSIMLDRGDLPAKDLRAIVDEIALLVTRVKRC